jgi:hypothetical protein
LISPTPSVEADDEESFSMDNSSSQETEPIGDGEQAEAQYEVRMVQLWIRRRGVRYLRNG